MRIEEADIHEFLKFLRMNKKKHYKEENIKKFKIVNYPGYDDPDKIRDVIAFDVISQIIDMNVIQLNSYEGDSFTGWDINRLVEVVHVKVKNSYLEKNSKKNTSWFFVDDKRFVLVYIFLYFLVKIYLGVQYNQQTIVRNMTGSENTRLKNRIFMIYREIIDKYFLEHAVNEVKEYFVLERISLIEKVLTGIEQNENYQIIAINGIHGIGKTTLFRSIREKIRQTGKLTYSIYEVKVSKENELRDFEDILKKIDKKESGKFLIVLEDYDNLTREKRIRIGKILNKIKVSNLTILISSKGFVFSEDIQKNIKEIYYLDSVKDDEIINFELLNDLKINKETLLKNTFCYPKLIEICVREKKNFIDIEEFRTIYFDEICEIKDDYELQRFQILSFLLTFRYLGPSKILQLLECSIPFSDSLSRLNLMAPEPNYISNILLSLGLIHPISVREINEGSSNQFYNANWFTPKIVREFIKAIFVEKYGQFSAIAKEHYFNELRLFKEKITQDQKLFLLREIGYHIFENGNATFEEVKTEINKFLIEEQIAIEYKEYKKYFLDDPEILDRI